MAVPKVFSPRAASATDALAVVDLGLRACAAYERSDLARRLEAARERLLDPSTRVLVVGEFKQGKSSLVNALLNMEVCPVDDDIATSVPTLVRHADQPTAVGHYEPDRDGTEATPESLDVDRLPDYVSEAGNPRNARRLRMVEVGVPRRLLDTGLSLVDTPGVGGLGSVHGALTVAALPSADAVLLVTDASQELTESEIRFLRHARELCPTVVLALTKIDLYPEWRKVLRLDQEHLDTHDFGDLEVIPVSSPLRVRALETGDRDLNRESGFGRLVDHLQEHVVGAAETLSIRTGANAVLQTAKHLRAHFEAELGAFRDPVQAERIQRDLQQAQHRAERLRSESAHWQTTLNDGIADLNADIDHDLRERTRRIIQEAEQRIDDGDPGEWWDEFDTWIQQRITEDLTENYTALTRQADALASTVAEHFAAAETTVQIGVDVEAPLDLLNALPVPEAGLAGIDAGVTGKMTSFVNRGHTALRGSYGGYLMFNMIGGMVGLAAMNPAILGLTVLLGRKSIRDEQKRELQQRRQTAKTVTRKYVDEINFQVGKNSRDTLRRVQRLLRDGLTERASQLQQTVGDSLQAAQQAAQADTGQREQRLRDVEAELSRIDGLEAKAAGLAPDLALREGAS